MAHSLPAARARSPSPPSVISHSGLSASGDRLGDLDAETLRLLDRSGSAADVGKLAVEFNQRKIDLKVGSVLVREWDGQLHRVMVLADSFAWHDKTYPSLSKVAFAMTGTRWNGPRFFGLRDKPTTEG
jgi:hypothetical protein